MNSKPMLLTAILAGVTCQLHAQEPLIPLISQAQADPDTALVISLLGENLSKRTFSFATVAAACSGRKVLPLTNDPVHQRVTAAISTALSQTINELNQPDSPARKLQRINEVSKLFEDGLHKHIDEMDGFKCGAPPTRSGEQQTAGYPDLRIVDEASKQVFYLDPKLVQQGSLDSTFRSFYFEPKNETLKITEDAVHLLVGIEHDGKVGEWTFSGWRLVDLSKLKVRLKAEFQASNSQVYQNTDLHKVEPPAPKPGETPPAQEATVQEKPPAENPPAETEPEPEEPSLEIPVDPKPGLHTPESPN